jgi:hypothetical protein
MMAKFSNLENRREISTQEAPRPVAWSEPEDEALETGRREPVTLEGKTTIIDRPMASSAANPMSDPIPRETSSDGPGTSSLFADSDVADFRSRWSNVQAGFVDQPRQSVEQAEELVSTVLQRLADSFTSERASLEKHWSNGESVSTEDLRMALQRYRAFFGKLLNAA